MTTEDWSLPNAVATDPTPRIVNQRVLIMNAAFRCAREHDGRIHASWMRDYLDMGALNKGMIGNVMSQLSNAGITERTGDFLPSAQIENRNKTKELPVRRVTDWHRFVNALMEMK